MGYMKQPKPTKLSPSSINLFLEDPARWVLRYGFGVKGRQSAAMLKGIAVEAGVQAIWWPTLTGRPMEEREAFALKVARNNFMLNLHADGGLRDSKDELAYESIEDALYHAVRGVTAIDPSMPLFQVRLGVKYAWSDVEGFCDFWWPTSGHLVDLKVTGRVQTSAPANHARQMAHYWDAIRRTGRTEPFKTYLLYASDKKLGLVEVPEDALIAAAGENYRTTRVIANALRLYDWDQMLGMYAPNFESYVWCEDSRLAAERLW